MPVHAMLLRSVCYVVPPRQQSRICVVVVNLRRIGTCATHTHTDHLHLLLRLLLSLHSPLSRIAAPESTRNPRSALPLPLTLTLAALCHGWLASWVMTYVNICTHCRWARPVEGLLIVLQSTRKPLVRPLNVLGWMYYCMLGHWHRGAAVFHHFQQVLLYMPTQYRGISYSQELRPRRRQQQRREPVDMVIPRPILSPG
jgi:hypothetical protein